MARRDRIAKLRRMAQQTDSPNEAEIARAELARMGALPAAAPPAASADLLVPAGRRNGVPHFVYQPPASPDRSPGQMPGCVRHPRKLRA